LTYLHVFDIEPLKIARLILTLTIIIIIIISISVQQAKKAIAKLKQRHVLLIPIGYTACRNKKGFGPMATKTAANAS
jgi:hypothetical protein